VESRDPPVGVSTDIEVPRSEKKRKRVGGEVSGNREGHLAKKKIKTNHAVLQNPIDAEEEQEIAWLEAKLGMRRGKGKKKSYEDDGLDGKLSNVFH